MDALSLLSNPLNSIATSFIVGLSSSFTFKHLLANIATSLNWVFHNFIASLPLPHPKTSHTHTHTPRFRKLLRFRFFSVDSSNRRWSKDRQRKQKKANQNPNRNCKQYNYLKFVESLGTTIQPRFKKKSSKIGRIRTNIKNFQVYRIFLETKY